MVRAWAPLALWTLVAFVLTVANQGARAAFALPAPDSPAGHALALSYLLLLLFALMQSARAATRLPQRTGRLLVLGLVLAAPLVLVLFLRGLRVPPPLLLALAATNLFLPAAAALAGVALGRLFRHPNTLLAAAGFAIFFDAVIVTMGTVAVLLQTSPQTIAAVSVGGGAPPGPRLLPPPLSGVTIGPADVLFLGTFLGAVAHLGLGERRTFAYVYGALALALALVQLSGWPVPALVPMGLAVLAANARHARFSREERYALLYGGVFALLLAAGMVAGARLLLAR